MAAAHQADIIGDTMPIYHALIEAEHSVVSDSVADGAEVVEDY